VRLKYQRYTAAVYLIKLLSLLSLVGIALVYGGTLV